MSVINLNNYKRDKPLVSCVMCTYGRFHIVQQSIAFWLLQDYKNKELIIYNTARKPLNLDDYLIHQNIKIINSNKEYTSLGQIRQDALCYAKGQYYIC